MAEEATKKSYLSLVGIIGAWLGMKAVNNGEVVQKWIPVLFFYVIRLLIIKVSQESLYLIYKNNFQSLNLRTINYRKWLKENLKYFIIFGIAAYNVDYQTVFSEDFLLMLAAYLICQYPEMEKQPMISYGIGMACSFFEGYLVHVIPSDGAFFVGFQENIRAHENQEGVIFPVHRLFIIITKSLYCPPDLAEFNKQNREDLPFIEAIRSLRDVIKDVAGVKERSYKNSAYKIVRRGGAPPVHVAAEFATPLHTLHKVLQKRGVYEQLCDVDVERVVSEFCAQLERVVARCPACRGKCELVYYDDTDESQNLADVLLAKIAEIEPNFEQVIAKGRRD